MSSTAADRRPVRARALRPGADRLEIVVDAPEATVEDLSVAVDRWRARIAVDHPDGEYARIVTPPAGRLFDAERVAVVNNGVLTVTVATTRSRVASSSRTRE